MLKNNRMKQVQLSLKRRFAIVVYALAILVFILFLTTINQIKNLKEYYKLNNEVSVLSGFCYTSDSLRILMFNLLPLDPDYFKTGESKYIDEINYFNASLTNTINHIENSFLLSKNKDTKLITFKINQQLKKYNDGLIYYKNLLNQRGYEEYGLTGKINFLLENLLNLSKNEGLTNVTEKINNISDFKNTYLLKKEPSIINRIRIEGEEAKTYAINSSKAQKLILLAKFQELEKLIDKLVAIDQTIGLTVNDGIFGQIKSAKEQFALNVNELKNHVNKKMDLAIRVGYFWLIALSLLIFTAIYILNSYLNQFIHSPLEDLKNYLSEMVKGRLPKLIKFNQKNEISDMADSLNKVVEGLKTKADFALEIGKGKLDYSYHLLSDDDILGNALIEMEKSLKKADLEDQKYKNEEKKRIWSNEGIAKFSEILRLYSNDINMLADEIIQNLVKYLNASLGGLFFYNDDQKDNIYLELVAAFAYDRKKYLKQTFKLGEGLIGTAVLEKERIFLTDIPENYLTVTSGLGEAPPRSILIIPLKLENEVLGVVELASFNIFEAHEIEFIEKVGQTIASTITNAKINARTSKLLEQSQKQAEEMAEQEEEMRQNMEELRTTQEDFNRREAEISGFLSAIQNSAMVMIFDKDRKIIDVNDMFVNTLNSKREDIIGRFHREFTSLSRTSDELDRFWNDLGAGLTQAVIEKIRLADGKEVYLEQKFFPILDKDKRLTKVLCISNNITENKINEKRLEENKNEKNKLSKELESVNTAIDSSFIRCEYSAEGRIIDLNENYCQFTGHTRSELINKINTIYLKEDEKKQFETIWNEVIQNKTYTGSVKLSKPTGEELWIMASFVPVKNDKGNITKIFFLGQNITEHRLKYQLLEEANKEIERLKKGKETNK